MRKNPKGIIIVLGMALFGLMAYMGILVELQILETVKSIKNTQMQYAADDVLGSMERYVRMTLNKKGPGYTKVQTCRYNAAGKTEMEDVMPELLADEEKYFNDESDLTGALAVKTGATTELCPELPAMMITNISGDEELRLKVKIKGRSLEADKVKQSIYGLQIDSFIVPQPGEGTAGECNVAGKNNLEFSCNWNKLTFGSNLTDRVAIPLFTADDAMSIKDSSFTLKVRTPCTPPNEKDSPAVKSAKESGNCNFIDRYNLYDGGSDKSTNKKNDIVVQWQINGECENNKKEFESCTFLPNVAYLKDSPEALKHSLITEYKINNYFIPSSNLTQTKHALVADGTKTTKPLSAIFNILKNGKLTLLISNKLLTFDKKIVPYLEYQILTTKAISNPSTNISIHVMSKSKIFTKEFDIEQKTELIDFAIQN